jgi:hypothetical protein
MLKSKQNMHVTMSAFTMADNLEVCYIKLQMCTSVSRSNPSQLFTGEHMKTSVCGCMVCLVKRTLDLGISVAYALPLTVVSNDAHVMPNTSLFRRRLLKHMFRREFLFPQLDLAN